MMYLEPMRKNTGALRVITGSHRSPFHEELMAFQQSHATEAPDFFGVKGADVPAYPVETDPGDLVVAGIPGEGATVKELRFDGTTVVLVPANPDFEEMQYPADEVTVFGRVVTVLRRL